MARKFLILGKYTQSGMAGALADGFESRREVMTDAITSMGGRLIDYSFCMGEYDSTVLAEYEDESKALALTLIPVAAGTVIANVIRLLTIEEMDQAREHFDLVHWTPPGQN